MNINEYEKILEEKGLDPIKLATEDIFEFSMAPHTEDDIRIKALAFPYLMEKGITEIKKIGKNGKSYKEKIVDYGVVFTYLCEQSVLSEEFIEELMFISSPLFSFNCYDKKHQDIAITLIDQCRYFEEVKNIADNILNKNIDVNEDFRSKILSDYKNITPLVDKVRANRKMVKCRLAEINAELEEPDLTRREKANLDYLKSKLENSDDVFMRGIKPIYNDRLDWFALCRYQNLSDEFKTKHANIIDAFGRMNDVDKYVEGLNI